jgi:hypothetical protein
MTHPESVLPTGHARAHLAPAPPSPVMTGSDRHEGLMAWSLMLGVLLVWFGVLPVLVS